MGEIWSGMDVCRKKNVYIYVKLTKVSRYFILYFISQKFLYVTLKFFYNREIV